MYTGMVFAMPSSSQKLFNSAMRYGQSQGWTSSECDRFARGLFTDSGVPDQGGWPSFVNSIPEFKDYLSTQNAASAAAKSGQAIGFKPTEDQQFLFVTTPTRPMIAPEPETTQETMSIPFNEVDKSSSLVQSVKDAANTAKQAAKEQTDLISSGKEAITSAKAAVTKQVLDTVVDISRNEVVQEVSAVSNEIKDVAEDKVDMALEAQNLAESIHGDITDALKGLQMSCSTCPISGVCDIFGSARSFLDDWTFSTDGFMSDMLNLLKKDFRIGLGILSSFDKCRKKLLGSDTKLAIVDSLSQAINDIGKSKGSGTGSSSTYKAMSGALKDIDMSGYSEVMYDQLFDLAVTASQTDDEAQVKSVHDLASNLKVNLLNLIGILPQDLEVEDAVLPDKRTVSVTVIDTEVLTKFSQSDFIRNILKDAIVDEDLYNITAAITA